MVVDTVFWKVERLIVMLLFVLINLVMGSNILLSIAVVFSVSLVV
jgi:hypothetical protein